MTLTKVTKLGTKKTLEYSLPARDAVIAAHAQDLGDYNFWDYETKYAHLVQRTTNGYVTCGDHTALEPIEERPETRMKKSIRTASEIVRSCQAILMEGRSRSRYYILRRSSNPGIGGDVAAELFHSSHTARYKPRAAWGVAIYQEYKTISCPRHLVDTLSGLTKEAASAVIDQLKIKYEIQEIEEQLG